MILGVALRSSRTRTTVPSRISRTIGSSTSERAFQASQAAHRVLADRTANSAASARRTRRVYHPSDATVAHLQNTFP